MRSFGFKHFRKFEDFPPIDLGSINVLVGPNNSGKSTFIKALRLMCFNLGRKYKYDFPFYKEFYFPEWTQGFKHYIPHFVPNGDMEFFASFDEFSFKMVLDNKSVFDSPKDRTEKIKLKSIEFCFYKFEMNASYLFNENNEGTLSISFSADKIKEKCNKKSWACFYDKAQEYIKDKTGSIEFELTADKECKSLLRLGKHILVSFPTSNTDNNERNKLNEGERQLLDFLFNDLAEYVLPVGEYHLISDIPAEGVPTDIIINGKKDNSDNTKPILDFYELDDSSKTKVCEWMYRFGICEEVKVERIETNIYRAEAKTNSTWQPLGVLGKGSRHLFSLFVNLILSLNYSKHFIIFIEEPEQNLHPALQSKLADLIFEVFESAKVKPTMIIETHSEYLIRRLQVLVSDKVSNHHEDIDKINTDVKVYYFPENGIPYSMDFCPSGHFEKQFGTGFFDEAGKQYKTILLKSI